MDQINFGRSDKIKLKSATIVMPKTSSCTRLKSGDNLYKPHGRFSSNPISLKHSLNEDLNLRRSIRGKLKIVSPKLDVNILNPIFLNDENEAFSRNSLQANADIYPKTTKYSQSDFNGFSMFKKILRDFSPSNLCLNGEKATIFHGIPKKNYAMFEKIRTLTNYINDTKKKHELRLKISQELNNDSKKATSPNNTEISKVLNQDIPFDELEPNNGTIFENDRERISNYLKRNPPENTEIDPKEYVEFYFIYKTDLEELWRYIRYLGVDVKDFTIHQIRDLFEKEMMKRKCISNTDQIRNNKAKVKNMREQKMRRSFILKELKKINREKVVRTAHAEKQYIQRRSIQIISKNEEVAIAIKERIFYKKNKQK